VTVQQGRDVADRSYSALLICTGNSARSIIAEAILNHLGRGRFKAYSAGTVPRGAVHPMTLDVLTESGYPVENLRSKSWAEFATSDAIPMDFIFTVCNQAAGETCPGWPGEPIIAHWDFVDPASVMGDYAKQLRAFGLDQHQIATRIRLFLSLPLDKLDRISLQIQLRGLGKSSVITTPR
jgi:arsenate reductase (thioredoxin)